MTEDDNQKVMISVCAICGEPIPFDTTPPVHSTCRAKSYKLHDSKGKIRMADRTIQMIEMRDTGYTYEEIGEKFGISRQRVHQILGNQRYDIKILSKASHSSRVMEFVVRYKLDHDGNSPRVREIMTACGMTYGPAMKALNTLVEAGKITVDNVGHKKVNIVGAQWVPPPEWEYLLNDIEDG
jgi:hypothetical protein